MINGGNLRRGNQVNYRIKDEAICLMRATLMQLLSETGFLARYRSGDELLVPLPKIDLEQALYLGRRCGTQLNEFKTGLF
jgi:GGDEF domain-containing protein